MTVFVYDTGMLIALEDRRNRSAAALHRWARAQTHPPVIPLPVLAQAWRPAPWTALTAVTAESVIFGTEARHGVLCAVCSAGHLSEDGKRAGKLMGKAAIPEKKRPDAVDALAVITAARHAESIIITSDPDDITAYRDALDPQPGVPLVLPVTEIDGFAQGELKALL